MVIDYEKLEYNVINEFNNWIKSLELLDDQSKASERNIGIFDKELNESVYGMRSRKNALKTQLRDEKPKSNLRSGTTVAELAQKEFKKALDDIRNIEDRESQINSNFNIDEKFGLFDYKIDEALEAEEYLATYRTYRKALEYVPKDTYNLAKSIKIKNNIVYVDLEQAPYGVYVHEASAWRHTNGTYDFLFRAAREVQSEMNNYVNRRTDEYYIFVDYHISDDILSVELIASDNRVNKNSDKWEYINMDRKLYKQYKRNKKTSKDNYKKFIESEWYDKNLDKLMNKKIERDERKQNKKIAKEIEKESLSGGGNYDNEF